MHLLKKFIYWPDGNNFIENPLLILCMTSTGRDDCLHPSQKQFVELLQVFYRDLSPDLSRNCFQSCNWSDDGSMAEVLVAQCDYCPNITLGYIFPPGYNEKNAKKILNLQKRAQKCSREQIRFRKKETRIFFLSFSKITSHFQTYVISERLRLQQRDWTQMKALSM